MNKTAIVIYGVLCASNGLMGVQLIRARDEVTDAHKLTGSAIYEGHRALDIGERAVTAAVQWRERARQCEVYTGYNVHAWDSGALDTGSGVTHYNLDGTWSASGSTRSVGVNTLNTCHVQGKWVECTPLSVNVSGTTNRAIGP